MSHPQFGASNASPRTSNASAAPRKSAARAGLNSALQRTARTSASAVHPSAPAAWTVRRKNINSGPSMPTRKYDVLWQARNGDIMDHQAAAPALPVFENAFNAFARGSLIPTPQGLVAIEDLLPGDLVETSDGDVFPIRWIGSMQLDPQGTRAPNAVAEKLYRLTSEDFGYACPSPDLMLGSGARYLHRADALKSYLGTAFALAPVATLADDHAVVEVTPMSSVRSYHICLQHHKLIRIHGLEFETFHPGTTASGQLIGDLRGQFMDLFPHLTELGDFGAMIHPRLSAGDLFSLNAA